MDFHRFAHAHFLRISFWTRHGTRKTLSKSVNIHITDQIKSIGMVDHEDTLKLQNSQQFQKKWGKTGKNRENSDIFCNCNKMQRSHAVDRQLPGEYIKERQIHSFLEKPIKVKFH